MSHKVLNYFAALLLLLSIVAVSIERPIMPREATWAPAFSLMGKFVQTADASLSRLLAMGEWDEAAFGEELKERLDDQYDVTAESIYLNNLLKELNINSRKGFAYKVYVDPYMAANAYAMPGGVIVFSEELIDLLENEAQVVSILAHEVAHIELDHCVNAFKFELAEREYDLEAGGIFRTLYNVLIGISFSKTEEEEADEYAFNLIVRRTDYIPSALGDSFQVFVETYGEKGEVGILEEFFQSHPDMVYRRFKYWERASQYSGTGKKYVGRQNLEMRQSKSEAEWPEEWSVY